MPLTIESAASLVSGATKEELRDMAQMQGSVDIQVLRSFYWEGKPRPVGEVLNVPKVFGLEMIAAKKATDQIVKSEPEKHAKASPGAATKEH